MTKFKKVIIKQKMLTTSYLILKESVVLWLPLILKKPSMIKFYPQWLLSLFPQRTAFKDGMIWVPFEGIKWLKSYLKKDMKVFEWGSGGSTLFFAQRAENLISVEHDTQWHKTISQLLKEKNITNCQYLLKEPEASGDQQDYLSSSPRYQGVNFRDYCKAIEAYPDNYFDLVSVDGRARNSCIKEAISKVRQGGYILLDDSNGEGYQKGVELLKNWKRRDFRGPKPYIINSYQTTLWQKV